MGERFGNYEILRKLAAGGMAEVLLAKQKGIGGFERLVCLKRILPHLSGQEEFMKMFQDEARIAANLVHPNIAQIYDISAENGQFFIAMEYVRGEDLRRIYNQEVSRGNCIPFGTAALIVAGAAAALDYAHRHSDLNGAPLDIVHRDVSPQNVLVTFDGHVKLIDFGVAKAAGKLNQTRAGVLKGKYSYMSPEQASGDPVDGRTDIFALGITLYEITCGTRLFKRDNELETLHAVVACQVPPPAQVKPGYDPELERIVLKSLAAEPERRYQTAGEMAQELETYLQRHGHPTSATGLAHYMQDLFAEMLADEGHFGNAPEGALPARAQAPLRALATVSTPADARATAEQDAAPRPAGDEATTVDSPPPEAQAAAPVAPNRRLTPEYTPEEWRVRPVREPTAAGGADARPTTLAGESPTRLPPSAAPRAISSQQSRRRSPLREPRPWSLPTIVALMVIAACGASLWRLAQRPADHASSDGVAKSTPIVPETDGGDANRASPSIAEVPAASAQSAPPQAAPPRAAVPAPRRAKAGQGALDIEAPLPMAVWLGGQYLGETPLAGVPMAAGSFRFKLENKREGLVTWRRSNLARGQRAKLTIEDRRGHVSVRGIPWVWVQRGLHPATESPLEADWLEGEYALTFECPDGRRTEHTLIVEAGRRSGVLVNCVAATLRSEHAVETAPTR